MKPVIVANNIPIEIFASRVFVTLAPYFVARCGIAASSLDQ
jgi:hypothetical protein